MDYREKRLRVQALFMKQTSLKYFPLPKSPRLHQLWVLSKSVVQARYLSGRVRVKSLTRQWGKANQDSICPLCWNVRPTQGTIEHILLSGGCPTLVEARLSMISFFQAYLVSRPYLFPIFRSLWGKDDMQTMQFLLDCSAIPLVIQQAQESETPVLRELFYLTRSYVFKLFVTRRRLIGTF